MGGQMMDMENFARRRHFEHFRTMAYPFVGVTADVDAAALVRACRARGISFYLMMVHAAALAADDVEELRQRIRGEGIFLYDECPTSHIELLENGTYCYCALRHHMPLAEYVAYSARTRELCRAEASIDEGVEAESFYFISTLPWIHYSAVIQPAAGGDDCNPRITWGRFEDERDGRRMMPVTVLAHHSLVDGVHLAAFYENLRARMEEIAEELEGMAGGEIFAESEG